MRLGDATFVAIDLETTGLDWKHDEIIAFAGIPIRDMRIKVGETCYTTICPDTYKLDSMKYHGISADDLQLSPCFADAASQILCALEGILIGYCVEMDYRFLQRFFKKTGIKLNRQIVDIALVERWITDTYGRRVTDQGLSFDLLLKRYGLQEHYRHNALADAFFSAQIFQLQMMKYNIGTMGKLMDILRCSSVSECAFLV
jgi:DNA polymerase III subunit epsilon